MLKILKLAAASAATLLAAGCVAYPYYDDPYYSGGYSGYSYSAPAPSVSFRYYDYDTHRYSYERRDDHRGRNWHRDHRRDDDRHHWYDGR